MKPFVKNSVLALLVILIVLMPLFFSKGTFLGTDDQATTAIKGIAPKYIPWFRQIYEPQSSEVESFLFAAQAAVGSGIVCYYLGYKKGEQKRSSHERKSS